jgi:magnesium chelatase family protein
VRLADDTPRLSTRAARDRVLAARGVARSRLDGTPWRLNAHTPGPWLRTRRMRLAPATTASIDRALERGGITMRGYDRVLRLAWTIADLEGSPVPQRDHVGRALYLRKAMSS